MGFFFPKDFFDCCFVLFFNSTSLLRAGSEGAKTRPSGATLVAQHLPVLRWGRAGPAETWQVKEMQNYGQKVNHIEMMRLPSDVGSKLFSKDCGGVVKEKGKLGTLEV